MTKRVIKTVYLNPPTPVRVYDWCATWEGRDPFDGNDPGSPIGYGSTELGAIKDLVECTEEL